MSTENDVFSLDNIEVKFIYINMKISDIHPTFENVSWRNWNQTTLTNRFWFAFHESHFRFVFGTHWVEFQIESFRHHLV